MKQIAILEYTFIFDEESPYRNVGQFERDLGLFFSNKGLEVQSVEVKGNSDSQVMYLKKPALQAPPINKEPMTFKQATPVRKDK